MISKILQLWRRLGDEHVLQLHDRCLRAIFPDLSHIIDRYNLVSVTVLYLVNGLGLSSFDT